jgi:hypothetical protein
MVSGCVGFLGIFAPLVRPARSLTARFVRKVSSFFQVVATVSDATDVLNRARLNPAERCEHFRNERREILHSIGPGSGDNDPERENGDILLVLEIAIDRDEGIDQAACPLQQGAVLCSLPAQALDRRNGMANQRGRSGRAEGSRQAVRARVIRLSRASSSAAMACSRRTDGNCRRNSSRVSPPSM